MSLYFWSVEVEGAKVYGFDEIDDSTKDKIEEGFEVIKHKLIKKYKKAGCSSYSFSVIAFNKVGE